MTDSEPARTDREPARTDRVIDLSVEVPGTPEQVWEAIATGPGISSWFVPHRVEEREGGDVRMDFGPDFGEESATVTAWEPPRRVVFESSGERALAFEWLVEARDGGTCIVRLVNTGFGPGEDWDADYDGMTAGWRGFLQNLRLHRTHFAGQRARAIIPTRFVPAGQAEAFTRLCAELGVPEGLRPGDQLETSGPGVPALRATVAEVARTDQATNYFLLLHTPAPGTALMSSEGAGEASMVSLYLYLYGDEAAALPDAWTPFFTEHFPAPAPAPVQA